MLIEITRNYSYITWEEEFGSIVFTNPLGNWHDLMWCTPWNAPKTIPSLQIPWSPSDFSLLFWDPNLLGALHVGNDLLWHPNAFGPIVGLLVHLDGHHLVIFLLQEIRCGGLFVHLVGVGVGELACLLFFSFFFSPPPFFTLHSWDLWPSLWHT